eukprot:824399-Ditylum_brightwellii.AAC.1
MSSLQDDTNIPAEAKVSYGSILIEATAKYEELVCSADWIPHKFKQFNRQGRNKTPPGTHPKSDDAKVQCGYCDEKDHIKSGCPCKYMKWYEVLPKNNQ